MRTRLSYKIFGAFLLTSLAVVGLTMGSLHYFGRRIFLDFVNKLEMEKISDLTAMLIAEYETSGGWSRLQSNPQLWGTMVRIAGHRNHEPGEMPPEGPPPDLREPPGRMESDDRPPPPYPPPPPPSPHGKEFFDGPFRIFLLDAQHELVAGRPRDARNAELREISLHDQAIGWLGINKGRPRLTPPEIDFLERQNELFYLIGAGVFMLTAIVSFLLSRHLLAPVKQLAEGTRALTSREFGTRIEVRSGDELGQLAADFNVMAHTLEQYEEMRRQWISDISHELRTPLSILRGEIEAMQDGVRDTNRQSLDSLYAEVIHLGKIVDDLHELSLADTGALHLERKPIDPVKVLRDTLSLFSTRYEQLDITLDEDLAAGQKALVLGDADRLAQLYANILENTLRYADAPGELKIRQILSDKRLTLIFEDSGPGVPEESVARLFDRLYRVDSARNRSKGGSGLGLAICKTIVENHGGTITAMNAPSGGLRVQVELPIRSATKIDGRNR